jgi:hypothetical protein
MHVWYAPAAILCGLNGCACTPNEADQPPLKAWVETLAVRPPISPSTLLLPQPKSRPLLSSATVKYPPRGPAPIGPTPRRRCYFSRRQETSQTARVLKAASRGVYLDFRTWSRLCPRLVSHDGLLVPQLKWDLAADILKTKYHRVIGVEPMIVSAGLRKCIRGSHFDRPLLGLL